MMENNNSFKCADCFKEFLHQDMKIGGYYSGNEPICEDCWEYLENEEKDYELREYERSIGREL